MARRLFSVLLPVLLASAGVGWGCDPWNNNPDPSSGSGPQANQMNTQRMPDVPYCRGGDRDKRCLLGTQCRVTNKGCQVCQCEGLDD